MPRSQLRRIIFVVWNKLITKHYFYKNNKSNKIENDCWSSQKCIENCLMTPLLRILYACLFDGVFLVELKILNVLPIHKQVDSKHFRNYRQISILPVISKIFGGAIANRISYLTNTSFYISANMIFKSKNQLWMGIVNLMRGYLKH